MARLGGGGAKNVLCISVKVLLDIYCFLQYLAAGSATLNSGHGFAFSYFQADILLNPNINNQRCNQRVKVQLPGGN